MSSDNNTSKRTPDRYFVANKRPRSTPLNLGDILAQLVQDGWLEATDICAVESTCRAAKKDWCSDKDVWKPLVFKAWPHLKDDSGALPKIGGKTIGAFKGIFCNPRLWLMASGDQVRLLPKWGEVAHIDVECGRCGCNCDDFCSGVPILSEHRYELKNQEVSVQKIAWLVRTIDSLLPVINTSPLCAVGAWL